VNVLPPVVPDTTLPLISTPKFVKGVPLPNVNILKVVAVAPPLLAIKLFD
jgi:hypothetical protein